MRYSVPEALAAFHARFAGASERVFAAGADEGGVSSYQRLVNGVSPGAVDVLDLACGDGALLARLRREGRALTGLDRSPEELAAARARLGPDVPLHLGLAQELPFADASFDAVTCHMAFMFFEEPERVVAELARALRPGGTFGAILGRSLPRDGFATDFFAALSEAEALDEQRIAWTLAAGREPSLQALFAGWDPQYTAFTLSISVPRDEVWAFLRLMFYDVGLLTDAASAWLEARTRALVEAHGVGDTLEWRVGMAELQATRPA